MKMLNPIKLTGTERVYAQKIVADKVTAETFKKRAQVILLLDRSIGEPEAHEKIGSRVGVTRQAINTIVKSYHEEGLEKAMVYTSSSKR